MPSKNLRNHFNEYSKTWATLGKFWTTLIVIRYVGQFCQWGKSLSKISKIIFFEARINDLMKTVKRGENVKKKTFSTRTTTGRIREMKMRVLGKLRIFPFSWLLSLSNFTNMYVINFLLWFFGEIFKTRQISINQCACGAWKGGSTGDNRRERGTRAAKYRFLKRAKFLIVLNYEADFIKTAQLHPKIWALGFTRKSGRSILP